MTKLRLKFVNAFRDRHGSVRHYFRRPGAKSAPLPGLPGSAAFMAAYQTALDTLSCSEIGASRTISGTFNALIVAYYKNTAFTDLAVATQNMRRAIIEGFRCEYGDRRATHLLRVHIDKLLAGKTPHAQKNWLKAIRPLMTFAVSVKMCAVNPTDGVTPSKARKSKGHMTWLEAEVAQYRKHHKIGTAARLALELLLNIAGRRQDAHALGRQHINKDGKLSWRPHKTARSTGKILTIRILPQLREALDAMPPSGELRFLLNHYGKPFASAAALGNKIADWCKAAGLKPVRCDDGKIRSYRAHGLRKAALRALAHSGCSGSEMMHVSGHSSLRQLQEYLDEVDQERQADAALDKLMAAEGKTATETYKPVAPNLQTSGQVVENKQPANDDGDPGWIRTSGPRLRRPVLYPAELRGRPAPWFTRAAPPWKGATWRA